MTNGARAFRGAACTERPVVGEAWRRSCELASLPYLTTSGPEELLVAARDSGGEALLVMVDGVLGADGVVGDLRAAGASVVLLTARVMSTPVRAALRAGVDGMITLGDPLETMQASIALLTEGASYVSPTAARLLLDEHRLPVRGGHDGLDVVLSGRERAVLQAMVDGLTTKATARHLGISTKTVEAHRSRLFTRLRVSSRSEAITRALTDATLLGPGPVSGRARP